MVFSIEQRRPSANPYELKNLSFWQNVDGAIWVFETCLPSSTEVLWDTVSSLRVLIICFAHQLCKFLHRKPNFYSSQNLCFAKSRQSKAPRSLGRGWLRGEKTVGPTRSVSGSGYGRSILGTGRLIMGMTDIDRVLPAVLISAAEVDNNFFMSSVIKTMIAS